MTELDTKKAATLLAKLYDAEFGNRKGRFYITRKDLKRLLNRKMLKSEELKQLGFDLPNVTNGRLCFIDMDDYFGILECKTIKNWRKATKSIIDSLL